MPNVASTCNDLYRQLATQFRQREINVPSNERWSSAHWALFQDLGKTAMAKQLSVREELLMHLVTQSHCHQAWDDAAQISEDLMIATAVVRLKKADLSELFSKLFHKVYRQSPHAASDAQ